MKKICISNEEMSYLSEIAVRKLPQTHRFSHFEHMNQFTKMNRFITVTSRYYYPLIGFGFLSIEFYIGLCTNIIVRQKKVFFD